MQNNEKKEEVGFGYEPGVVEVTVKLKSDDKTYRQEFLHYGALIISENSQDLKEYVKQARESFKDTPTDISLKMNFVWQAD